MSLNPNPKTLDDLLDCARHYAEFCMRGTGNLPPTLFLIGSDGKQVMFMPKNMADVQAKDDFASISKLMAIACGATVGVMALEAWVKSAKPGEKIDTTEPPSEAFDRQECVVLIGESTTEGRKQQMLPIIRSGNHKFFGFGESADMILLEKSLMVLEEGVLEGRKVFANITKYIRMGASSNFGNMFSVLGASAWFPFLPMQPLQILTNNLLYDFSQVPIPTDNVGAQYIAKPLSLIHI